MNDREAVKVLIVNDDGQYLAGTATDWEFTDDRSKATVFDYLERPGGGDASIWSARPTGGFGSPLSWTRGKCMSFVTGADAGCGPSRLFFDGQQFLCGDCREDAFRRLSQASQPQSPVAGLGASVFLRHQVSVLLRIVRAGHFSHNHDWHCVCTLRSPHCQDRRQTCGSRDAEQVHESVYTQHSNWMVLSGTIQVDA